jgi:glycosyltransferase involved in cell wall biosynthesis
MMKKVIIRGPALTQSGYGEHTRFLLRALRKCPDKFDIYLIPVNWGQTGWLHSDTEERRWLDEIIKKTHIYSNAGGAYDMSIQVTIPNEWTNMAPCNIGVTAGIETTKVSPVWLEKANMMDKVITISEHSKQIFESTDYRGIHKETRQEMHLKCEVPIEVVHYPVKKCEPREISLNLDYDFNYLTMAQWGPRKNLENTIRWWIEENFDEEVGLIVKTSMKNNSIMDREHAFRSMTQLVKSVATPDMKCKVYFLHGDLAEEEIQYLYTHPKIKCMVSLSHGEGFGLPLFDAACHGLPIIAPAWSGHCDFLYMPNSSGKRKAMFANVNYDLRPVQSSAVWKGVIEKDSMWCHSHEGHYKMRLRQVRKNYDKWLTKAKALQGWVQEHFESEKQHKLFADAFPSGPSAQDKIEDMFSRVMNNR